MESSNTANPGNNKQTTPYLNDSLFLDEPIENLVARLRNRNQSSALKRLEEEARILKSIHAKISEQLHRLQMEEEVFQRELEALLQRGPTNPTLLAQITEVLSSDSNMNISSPLTEAMNVSVPLEPLPLPSSSSSSSSQQLQPPKSPPQQPLQSQISAPSSLSLLLDPTLVTSSDSTEVLQGVARVKAELEREKEKHLLELRRTTDNTLLLSPAHEPKTQSFIENDDLDEDNETVQQMEAILKQYYGEEYSKAINSVDSDDDASDDDDE